MQQAAACRLVNQIPPQSFSTNERSVRSLTESSVSSLDFELIDYNVSEDIDATLAPELTSSCADKDESSGPEEDSIRSETKTTNMPSGMTTLDDIQLARSAEKSADTSETVRTLFRFAPSKTGHKVSHQINLNLDFQFDQGNPILSESDESASSSIADKLDQNDDCVSNGQPFQTQKELKAYFEREAAKTVPDDPKRIKRKPQISEFAHLKARNLLENITVGDESFPERKENIAATSAADEEIPESLMAIASIGGRQGTFEERYVNILQTARTNEEKDLVFMDNMIIADGYPTRHFRKYEQEISRRTEWSGLIGIIMIKWLKKSTFL